MKIHIVKQGDTLFELSQKYGLPLEDLIKANPQIADPDVLHIGDKVKIPGAGTLPDQGEMYYKHTVQQGDTLWKLSKAWGVQLKDVIEANPQLKNPDVLKVGEVVYIPKKGAVAPAEPAGTESAGTIVGGEATGGKTYTGPIEQVPGKTYTGPIEQAPGKTNTGPVIQPAPPVQVVPAPAPVPEIVTETQSLFVQISVPAQEAVVYQPQPMPAPAPCPAEPAGCGGVSGYPGLTENPHFYDCPPVYPMYQSVGCAPAPCGPSPHAMMCGTTLPAPAPAYGDSCYPGISASDYTPCGMEGMMNYTSGSYPSVIQPSSAYTPSHFGMHGYPEHMYAQPSCPPDAYTASMPGYAPSTPAYTAPVYSQQMPSMPWPSCGCGEGQSWPAAQAYPSGSETVPGGGMAYAPPAYAPYPYPGWNPGAYPAQMAASPVLPTIPEFPGTDWPYLNRIQPLAQVQNTADPIPSASEETPAKEESAPAAKSKAGERGKAKVSGQESSKKAASETRSKKSPNKNEPETAKKRKNPWISR
ncbi:LysM peptidoglycan-binding domain-containing protein [Paenibacillus spiritus]|uniref:LysM peptidoglycan-binding domain-containing protein n=1 Tax=Paenibacillus spiritus TaxID=2496557 RepID=A0A5J5G1R2_9BACL|nr:LysM domain-containing protein [Paenibacillus spiritus]KAA9000422.1 LysM peptidoglycan-binding domain-containing protein [Paenibacillus spiritus]